MSILARVGTLLLLMALALASAACGEAAKSTTSTGDAAVGTTVTSPVAFGTTTAVTTPETAIPPSAVATTGDLPTTTTSDTAPAGSPGQTQAKSTRVHQEAQVGDWNVVVVSVTWNADTVVANHSEFNDPPEDGHQYVLVKVQATRTGEGSASFITDVYCTFLGSGGDVFDAVPQDIPDAIREAEDVETGSTLTGYMVFQVSSDQVNGGQLVMEAASSSDGSQVIFDLG